ncbi:MAG TPA: phosphate signaling complex protein PhoU, partial [candidate division Zixibacteria bacterium]|nr:phosphate signaling complex protein PhoU [candidate division Zixibacteria bacterium]
MTRHLQREIERIKKKILSLSAMVEERLHLSVKSIAERNSEMALRVCESDWEIDRMEVEVEEDCLKILALHQPVAIDLRFLIAVLKINSDLERIGDLAAGIAEQGIFLAARPRVVLPFDFPRMAEIAKDMLKGAIDSLVSMNPDLAAGVCLRDDEID